MNVPEFLPETAPGDITLLMPRNRDGQHIIALFHYSNPGGWSMIQTMEPHRIPFAAGDYLVRYPAGSEFDLEIESPIAKPGWQPRQMHGPRNLIFPGSAVVFESNIFEIVRMESETGTGTDPVVRYFLKAWEERFPIRVQFHYSKEECERLASLLRERKKANKINITILLLAPVIGLLPGEDQLRLEKEYGVPSLRLTFLSALPLLIAGSAGLVSLLVAAYSRGLEASIPVKLPLQLAGCYFFLESLVRLHSCMVQEDPMGTLPVFLVIETYRMIRRSMDPDIRKREIETQWKGNASLYLNTQDQVSEISGSDYDLEVYSNLPKPHWSMLTGIIYNETWYGLVDSDTIREEEQTRYRFRLKKAPSGSVFRSTTRYTPDEIGRLYKEERRREMGVLVRTFAPFWGLLDEAEQERLEELYDFDTLKFTHISVIAIALLAFFNFIASIAKLLSGIGTPIDFLILIVSGYLLVESYRRREKWKAGKPSGSALAVFLRPFSSKLLR